MKKRFFIPLLLIALLALLAVLLPWKKIITEKAQAILAEKGLPQARFSLETIGLNGLTLRDVALGGDDAPALSSLTLHYSLASLREGAVDAATLKGLNLVLRAEDGNWQMHGLPRADKEPAQKTPFALPVSRAALKALPLRRITLEESALNLSSDTLNAALPFSLTLEEKDSTPRLSVTISDAQIKKESLALNPADITISAALDEKSARWQGDWSLKNLSVQADQTTLPPLNGTGTLQADAEKLTLQGSLASTDKSHRATFALEQFFSSGKPSALLVREALLPWQGGVLAVADMRIPLAGNKATRFILQVRKVPLDALMHLLTGNQADATGTVSGALPIHLLADGALQIDPGTLKADAPGVIRLNEGAIPGDVEQVALVRDILKNLHYTLLSVKTETGKDGKLNVLLAVEGHNPDAAAGKPVKLNVHLSGDLLKLIQQNVMSLLDPKTLLKQGRDAKP